MHALTHQKAEVAESVSNASVPVSFDISLDDDDDEIFSAVPDKDLQVSGSMPSSMRHHGPVFYNCMKIIYK